MSDVAKIGMKPIKYCASIDLCRTNARAMSLRISDLVNGDKIALQADSERLLKFVEVALKAGRRVFDAPELAWFSNWQNVHEYCETHDGNDIESLLKITPVASADYVI